MQCTNLQWNNRLINLKRLYILCEKSGALCLAEPGLTAVGRQGGRQTNSSEFLKLVKLVVLQQ